MAADSDAGDFECSLGGEEACESFADAGEDGALVVFDSADGSGTVVVDLESGVI